MRKFGPYFDSLKKNDRAYPGLPKSLGHAMQKGRPKEKYPGTQAGVVQQGGTCVTAHTTQSSTVIRVLDTPLIAERAQTTRR